MHTANHIERIESGHSWQDRSSGEYEGYCEGIAAAEAEHALSAQFAKAANGGDANALCPWAPQTTDWDAMKRAPVDRRTATSLPRRAQTLAECMTESLGYGDGPSITEAMQLVLNVASGVPGAFTQQHAQQLLVRMGASFARHNS